MNIGTSSAAILVTPTMGTYSLIRSYYSSCICNIVNTTSTRSEQLLSHLLCVINKTQFFLIISRTLQVYINHILQQLHRASTLPHCYLLFIHNVLMCSNILWIEISLFTESAVFYTVFWPENSQCGSKHVDLRNIKNVVVLTVLVCIISVDLCRTNHSQLQIQTVSQAVQYTNVGQWTGCLWKPRLRFATVNWTVHFKWAFHTSLNTSMITLRTEVRLNYIAHDKATTVKWM